MYLLNKTSDFPEKVVSPIDTWIKAKYFFFFFLHGFGVRGLHKTISKPLEIWLWVLGIHVPRLALIWKLEDRDEKKHITLAGSVTKEMNNIRLSMSFNELFNAFQSVNHSA